MPQLETYCTGYTGAEVIRYGFAEDRPLRRDASLPFRTSKASERQNTWQARSSSGWMEVHTTDGSNAT